MSLPSKEERNICTPAEEAECTIRTKSEITIFVGWGISALSQFVVIHDLGERHGKAIQINSRKKKNAAESERRCV